MDVVRRNIEALRGRIEIQTARGQGTTFSIRLPLTLAIVDGIMRRASAHERFVIPAFAVRESLRPKAEQIHSVYGQPCMVQVRDRLIPSLHLGDLFGDRRARSATITNATVVVLEDNGRPTALIVDELIGKQEVVIKSLGEHVRGRPRRRRRRHPRRRPRRADPRRGRPGRPDGQGRGAPRRVIGRWPGP